MNLPLDIAKTRYVLNVGALALWLTISLVGLSAFCFPEKTPSHEVITSLDNLSTPTIQINSASSQPSSDPAEELNSVEDSPSPLVDEMPSAMPAIATFEPLPQIPPISSNNEKNPAAQQASPSLPTKPKSPKGKTVKSSSNNQSSTASSTSSNASENASRLDSGIMKRPSYPEQARRAQQQGTVVIEFNVDTSGKVTSAYVKNASAYPVLNRAALDAVKRWKFPPGKSSFTKVQEIVFELK
jgi:periplasmic protein TonB